jgi:hypothetical protein
VPDGARAGEHTADDNAAGMLQAIQESIRNFILDIGMNNTGDDDGHPARAEHDDHDENNQEFD